MVDYKTNTNGSSLDEHLFYDRFGIRRYEEIIGRIKKDGWTQKFLSQYEAFLKSELRNIKFHGGPNECVNDLDLVFYLGLNSEMRKRFKATMHDLVESDHGEGVGDLQKILNNCSNLKQPEEL